MKVTLAQLNPIVGDIEGNFKKVIEVLDNKSTETDIVVFPELFLTGYPPKDLLEMPWFIEKCGEAVRNLAKASEKYRPVGIIIGAPVMSGDALYNSAIFIRGGKVLFTQHKMLLPSYDVFDEKRYFKSPASVDVVEFMSERLGISICEDAWNVPESGTGNWYERDPIAELARKGATIMINISASPFNMGKEEERYMVIGGHARKYGVPFIYVNQVGGNDELIFDGRSMAFDKNGDPQDIMSPFTENVRTIETALPGNRGAYVPRDRIASLHDALVLGIRDYVRKCGFQKAVVGLSGGIDSSLVCSLAAEALGKENITGITMPSKFSSRGSVEDSMKLSSNLGIEFLNIPISGIFDSCMKATKKIFAGKESDKTEENLQARIRGSILMAFSNKFGHLPLSTGNKSELAVGYCTLYGDMSGGLAVISDVPKTAVYKLAEYINRTKGEIIPQAVFRKPPSAELKSNQTDQDTLPPYDILDRILEHLIEEGMPAVEIARNGFNKRIVDWTVEAVKKNEYKRKQAPLGLKVTPKAFGSGRRMPIAAKY